MVSALLLVSLLAACGGEGAARRRYERAQELLEQGRFEEGAHLLEEIADRYPETDTGRRAAEEVTLYRGLASAVTSYPLRRVRDEMIRTARAVYRYRNRRGGWPASLDELAPRYLDARPVDPWGRAFVYRVRPRARGYVLACYGSDGERGGTGEARDWFIENGRFVAEPSVPLP